MKIDNRFNKRGIFQFLFWIILAIAAVVIIGVFGGR
jgi:hypothetical protein